MRLVRGKRKTYPRLPKWLNEAAPGAVLLIPVRVGAHFGDRDTLCRPANLDRREELYQCGDLLITRAQLVAVFDPEEVFSR